MSLDSYQSIQDAIQQAVRCVLADEIVKARRIIAGMDYATIADYRMKLRTSVWSTSQKRAAEPTIKTKRVAVPEVRKLKVFRRDHFICRYAHCNRRTLYIPVIKELSRLFPDLLSYRSNWNPVAEHLLYWVFGTSLEHKLSFPHRGDSGEANLITACYCCNDAKNSLHLSDLAWEVSEIADSDWDGLERFLAPLMKISATPGGTSTKQSTSRKKLSQ